ncbi:MAG: hypothetical protein KBB88_03860, partial [Candidatus Pacebacteria bacterium]|nr:hypothetical protein [Candidatus Paceibacterota bacterium]
MTYFVTASCSLTVKEAGTPIGFGTTVTIKSKTCRLPVCLKNPSIGVSTNDVPPANAVPLSSDELPTSLKLVRDYTTTLVDPITRPNTTKGCEYTCDNGYKLVTESGITKCIPIV